MKITFDNDKNYIEIVKGNNDKIIVSLSAQDSNNPRRAIINSAEISREDLIKLMQEVLPREDEKK